MDSKIALRKKFSQLRSAIKPADREKAMLDATKYFLELPFFKESIAVACYLSTPQEFDTKAIIEAIWQRQCKCYLPVMLEDKKLNFVRYKYGDKLRKNAVGILEPVTQEMIDPQMLDLVITPLVAFDREGHRLGTGGGYYDQSFEFLQHAYLHKPFILGLAFAIQETEKIPVAPWDVNMDGVLTEKGFFRPI